MLKKLLLCAFTAAFLFSCTEAEAPVEYSRELSPAEAGEFTASFSASSSTALRSAESDSEPTAVREDIPREDGATEYILTDSAITIHVVSDLTNDPATLTTTMVLNEYTFDGYTVSGSYKLTSTTIGQSTTIEWEQTFIIQFNNEIYTYSSVLKDSVLTYQINNVSGSYPLPAL